MKKQSLRVLFLFFFIFILAPLAYSDDSIPFGKGDIAFKAGQIMFTDELLKEQGIDKSNYIAVEVYDVINQNLYWGTEVGHVNASGAYKAGGSNFKDEIAFVPVEVNLKFAQRISQHTAFSLGAGVSYNYAKHESTSSDLVPGYVVIGTASSWLAGGQFFGDLNYTSEGFFAGIEGKFQSTAKLSAEVQETFGGTVVTFKVDEDFSNWRVGGKVGFMF